MEITTTPTKTFDIVLINTVLCDLSKYLVAIQIRDKESNAIIRAAANSFILI